MRLGGSLRRRRRDPSTPGRAGGRTVPEISSGDSTHDGDANFGSPPADVPPGGLGGDHCHAHDGYEYRVYCGTRLDSAYADGAKKTDPNNTGARIFADDSCERVAAPRGRGGEYRNRIRVS